jgi:hypothetical protein
VELASTIHWHYRKAASRRARASFLTSDSYPTDLMISILKMKCDRIDMNLDICNCYPVAPAAALKLLENGLSEINFDRFRHI